MMPVTVKKLYMASNITELRKKSELSIDSAKDKNTKLLATSLLKLCKSAKDALDQEVEDEELIYIYLYRATELWFVISRSNEFKSDKKYYTLMFGNQIKEYVDLLTEYSDRLIERYKKMDQDREECEDSITKFQYTPGVVVKKRKGGKGSNESLIPNGVENHDDSTGNHNDLQDYNLIIKQKIKATTPDDGYEKKKFIQCSELKELLPSNMDVLVIDIRPEKDFEMSKITNVHSINIPYTSISGGDSANKLATMITDRIQKKYWGQRDQYEQLVLMDWNSEEKVVIPSSPLSILQNIFLKWDPSIIYKNRPLVLNGGFERWLDTYPTYTTNAKIERPKKPITSPFTNLWDQDIEYPMNVLDDIITPKPKTVSKPAETVTVPNPTSTPTVDRSTKPDTSTGKAEKPRHEAVNDETPKTERPKPSAHSEPMEDDKGSTVKNLKDHDESVTPVAATTERPQDQSAEIHYPHEPSPPMRPATPPRLEQKTYPTTPKKSIDKGDGDRDIHFERLSDGVSRSGGLKRSASSPNINKLANEELDVSSKSIGTPLFDRSTKPKPSSNKDNYSPRGAGTDTIYQANSKKSRGLTGLKNLGNLCYMNSIMQCISNTVELTKELTRFDPKISCRRQIASEVSTLLRTLWQGDTRLTSCRSLKGRVGALRPNFSTMEQQDSHEFLTIIMDWLHEDLNQPSPNVSLEGAIEETGEKAWGEFKKKNNSVVLDLFFGQQKSTVTCNYCQKQSIQFEPFSHLSVPLPPPNETSYDKESKFSVQECLKLYLKGETISGWVCPSCKTEREATKKLDITRLPPVLIIHLKRFMTEMAGMGWCRKRMSLVEFPMNDFDMKPYTHPESELRVHNYNLYAVSNHYGQMDGGHYTAYCKNHLLKKWYKFDDHDVNEMFPADVKSPAAYILFYESSHLEKNNRIFD